MSKSETGTGAALDVHMNSGHTFTYRAVGRIDAKAPGIVLLYEATTNRLLAGIPVAQIERIEPAKPAGDHDE
jgi:hypothetical protein